MDSQKKKACQHDDDDRPKNEVEMLLDTARIIAKTSDPVKLVAPLIEYHRLSVKLYKKNSKVK